MKGALERCSDTAQATTTPTTLVDPPNDCTTISAHLAPSRPEDYLE
jgi:hypothetical protein